MGLALASLISAAPGPMADTVVAICDGRLEMKSKRRVTCHTMRRKWMEDKQDSLGYLTNNDDERKVMNRLRREELGRLLEHQQSGKSIAMLNLESSEPDDDDYIPSCSSESDSEGDSVAMCDEDELDDPALSPISQSNILPSTPSRLRTTRRN